MRRPRLAAQLLCGQAQNRRDSPREGDMKVNKILVPLDGSSIAEAALPTAIELARANPGAAITLLRAAHAASMVPGDAISLEVMVVREAEEYLDAVARRLAPLGLRVKTSVWYGPPAASIVEAAEAGKVDLIVMNSHGRSGLNRLVLGSVAESVLRGTSTPVLLLRAPGAPLEPPAGPTEQRSTKEAARV
jgi:nucleotide-binding universal stress UspA family protein